MKSLRVLHMGVGRIFSRGGAKVVKFGFYPSKLKKTFFAEHFKIQGEALTLPAPPFRRPWSCMRVIVNPCCCEISQFSTWFRRVWEVIFLHWNKQKMGSYLQSVSRVQYNQTTGLLVLNKSGCYKQVFVCLLSRRWCFGKRLEEILSS